MAKIRLKYLTLVYNAVFPESQSPTSKIPLRLLEPLRQKKNTAIKSTMFMKS